MHAGNEANANTMKAMAFTLEIKYNEPVAKPTFYSHAKSAKFAKSSMKQNFAYFANLA